MFIGDPKHMVESDKSYRSGKSDTANYILKNMVQGAKFFRENYQSKPNDIEYAKVARYVEETLNVSFAIADAKMLLEIYPRARIKVAKFGIEDTDVREEISFAISHFFLGCDWPGSDDVDHEEFCNLLTRQAVEAGFEPLTNK